MPPVSAVVQLLGVRIHPLTVADLLAVIRAAVENHERRVIANVNAHALNLAHEQPWLRDFFNGCEYVFCDGFGVKWAARLFGAQLPARMTPPDWLPLLAERAAKSNWTLYFLGNRPGVAERAAETLRHQYPQLVIAGCQHGYFEKGPGHPENEAVIQAINAVRPNILYVGFGMPMQERWIKVNRERLSVNVILPVGAMLDYAAGETRRGPRWMTDHGLEWLARLLVEPRRLWKRYLIGNPLFISRVLAQRFGLRRYE